MHIGQQVYSPLISRNKKELLFLSISIGPLKILIRKASNKDSAQPLLYSGTDSTPLSCVALLSNSILPKRKVMPALTNRLTYLEELEEM